MLFGRVNWLKVQFYFYNIIFIFINQHYRFWMIKGVLFISAACKDLAQRSYFLASNSLHLTTMCLQYKSTVVACFCIYLACKWSRWEVRNTVSTFFETKPIKWQIDFYLILTLLQIPTSNEGKEWFYYVDKSVTMELLERLTDEFLAIYDRSSAKLKKQLKYDLTHNARPVCISSSSEMNQIWFCFFFFSFTEWFA